MLIDLKMSIGDSVTKHPALAGIYMTYGIDYCCGGDRTIDEAIADSDSDRDEIVNSLNDKLLSISENGESFIQLSELNNSQLIDNIIEQHHVFLRETLPVLGSYLFKLIEVHGQSHPELFDIHRLVGALRIDLEEHLIKEEKQLFPLILEEKDEEASSLIASLESEHDAAGDILKKLTEVTDHFKLPKDACNTYKVTYKLLQDLQVDMYQHVHKENSILFKRFE